MKMRVAAMVLCAGAMSACMLSACVNTNLAPGKTPEQAAAVNVQLAIEYLKIGKLAASREFIERALSQDPHSATVQETAGFGVPNGSLTPRSESLTAPIRRRRDGPLSVGRRDHHVSIT